MEEEHPPQPAPESSRAREVASLKRKRVEPRREAEEEEDEDDIWENFPPCRLYETHPLPKRLRRASLWEYPLVDMVFHKRGADKHSADLVTTQEEKSTVERSFNFRRYEKYTRNEQIGALAPIRSEKDTMHLQEAMFLSPSTIEAGFRLQFDDDGHDEVEFIVSMVIPAVARHSARIHLNEMVVNNQILGALFEDKNMLVTIHLGPCMRGMPNLVRLEMHATVNTRHIWESIQLYRDTGCADIFYILQPK